jgi:hypothetical protein
LCIPVDFQKAPLKSLTHSLLDIQEGNIMIGVDDDTIFKNFVQEELAEPSLRKIDGDSIIYVTRQVEIPDNPSHFILCDFGDAQSGEETYIGEVMPDLYRAPEIVLGIEWNEKIDIWSEASWQVRYLLWSQNGTDIEGLGSV